ncbi:MAG: hypothetical protein IPL96_04010 [Holophagaceae bacterium]|nr:hypothetical protein [Holophagaceae bacterium]
MRLSPAVLALAVSGAFAAPVPWPLPLPATAEPQPRPTVQSLVLTLDDGSSLTLEGNQLGTSEGGFLVWNSFGVTQIAMAYLAGRADNPLSPDAIWNLWSPEAEAEAPVAFLVTGGTLTPIGGAQPGARAQRAKLVSLVVTLSNGKSRTMPYKMLEDPINGVLAWGDATIRATLVPFYDARPGLRSTSSTVLTRWNALSPEGDLAGTMTKPLCDPSGWP